MSSDLENLTRAIKEAGYLSSATVTEMLTLIHVITSIKLGRQAGCLPTSPAEQVRLGLEQRPGALAR